MPAIHIAKLRKQAVELAEYFFEPERFDFHFTQLLDFYSNRTKKPGKPKSSATRLKTYEVQDPIIRAVLTEIEPFATQDPVAALSLACLLWEKLVLEKRIMAIRLLGILPQEDSRSTVKLIEKWVKNNHDDQLLVEFSSHPLLKLHLSHWKLYLTHLNKWLGSENQILIRLSLTSISKMLNERDIADLPPIFKLLTPYFSDPPFKLRSLLSPILKSLTRQSPDEVMYLIRQIYDSKSKVSRNFKWLLNQNKDFFPESYQDSIESMIHKK